MNGRPLASGGPLHMSAAVRNMIIGERIYATERIELVGRDVCKFPPNGAVRTAIQPRSTGF